MKYLFFVLLISYVFANCDYNPNRLDVIDDDWTLLQEVTNGKKYLVGDESNYLYVAKVKGTSYEMGKAFGELFKQELADQVSNFYKYIKQQLNQTIAEKLPKFVVDPIVNGATTLIQKLLALNVFITKKYTNPRYYQQIKGIAAGSGVKAKLLRQLNIFPQLIKAACSVVGVWGNASASHDTLHMRALDWDAMFPISKYPLAISYLPSNSSLHPHINFAWVGFVGSLTGISDKVALGQKVWLPKKHSVPMTRYGNPWTYVLRDVLYEATNITTALDILKKAHRTCAIHLGLSGVEDHSFRMIEYSYKTLNVYNDKNYTYTKEHPQKDGIAFFDKHVQPSKDTCIPDLLFKQNFYGNWDIDSFWRVIGNSHKTGDTQLVVFNLQKQLTQIAYSQYITGKPAYSRRPFLLSNAALLETF